VKKKTEENYKKARIQFSHKLESKQTPTKGKRKKKSLLRAKITQIGSKQAQTEAYRAKEELSQQQLEIEQKQTTDTGDQNRSIHSAQNSNSRG
jgi:hypothetical protein